MKRYYIALLLWIAFSANLPAQEVPYNPNVKGGVVDVSATGAATYMLPIDVSFGGQGGLCPSIAVTYNSQAGNGLLGYGFSLTGVHSSVTRIPKTIYLDGAAGPVDYTLPQNAGFTERLAIDGNALMKVGESSTQIDYRFEVDNFSTIALKKSDNAAQTITVKAKDGTQYVYGGVADEGWGFPYAKVCYRLSYPGANLGIAEWYLNKVVDANGNTMEYFYTAGTSTTCSYLESVFGTFGLVRFFYEDRPDAVTLSISGRQLKMQKRLKSIIIDPASSDNSKIYEFAYTADTYSRLSSITEVSESGVRTLVNTFSWGGYPTPGMAPVSANVAVGACPHEADFLNQSFLAADVNNDGLTDLVGIYNYTEKIDGSSWNYNAAEYYIASRSVYETINFTPKGIRYHGIPKNRNLQEIATSNGRALLGDFYGDGSTPLVFPYVEIPSSGTCYMYFTPPHLWRDINDYNIYETSLSLSREAPVFGAGDLDNDGKTELIYVEKGRDANGKYLLKMLSAVKNGSTQVATIPISMGTRHPQRMIVNDFDGDGMQDILLANESDFYIFWNKGRGLSVSFSDASVSNYGVFNSRFSVIEIGDFNGDGLPDFILNEHCNENWHIALNNGNKGFIRTALSNITALGIVEEDFTEKNDRSDRCFVTDFDGDGKSDIIINDSKYTRGDDIWTKPWGKFQEHNVYWFRSTGSGFTLINQRRYTSENGLKDASNFAFGDFDGDGHTELMHYGYNCYTGDNTQAWRMHKPANMNISSGRITDVVNGAGKVVEKIEYQSLSNTGVYSLAAIAPAYPVIQYAVPLALVSAIRHNNGIGEYNTTSYTYKGVRLHAHGKGLLGFSEITSSSSVDNRKHIQTFSYNPSYPLPYLSTSETKTVSGNKSVAKMYYYQYLQALEGKRVFVSVQPVFSIDYLAGNAMHMSYTYDSNGNLRFTEERDEQYLFRNTTSYTYTHVAGNGIPNKQDSITHRQYYSGALKYTTLQTLAYTAKGNLTKTVESVNNQPPITTSYGNHTSFTSHYSERVAGLPQTITTSAAGLDSITKRLEYDHWGRVTKRTNALGQSTSATYDSFGRIIATKDQLNQTTTYAYNSAENEVKVTNSLGATQTSVWHRAVPPFAAVYGYPANALYKQVVYKSNGAATTTYYDVLFRPVRNVSINAKSTDVHVNNTYRSDGLLHTTSYPHFWNETNEPQISYLYDEYGRTKSKTDNGLETTYTYNGRTTTVTTPDGKTSSTTLNAAGDVVRTTDAAGSAVEYTYHSVGKPSSIVAAGAEYLMEYDACGRQRKLTDPDAGTTTYRYNAYGRLTSQTDARGYADSMCYDKLGRVVYKYTPEDTYYYAYGNAGLTSVRHASNPWNQFSKTSVPEYEYIYDSYGRLTRKKTYFESYPIWHDFIYNEQGQLVKETPGFYTAYMYYQYANGYLTGVDVAAINVSRQAVWRLQGQNALGQPLHYGWGNGQHTALTYDSYGQLQSKNTTGSTLPTQTYNFNPYSGNLCIRTIGEKQETFGYDALNRLTQCYPEHLDNPEPLSLERLIAATTVTDYAANGNIARKSDVGSYTYNAQRPHAVDRLVNIPEEKEFDMLRIGTQRIKYDSKNRPLYIAQGADSLRLYYDHTGQRLYARHYKGGALYKTTYYAGIYEEEEYAGGALRTRCFINTPTGLHAVLEEEGPAFTTPQAHLLYTHTDHLGSIVALSDADGALQQEYSYDPWGRLRDPHTLSPYSPGQEPELRLGRGYTGHEHLPQFGLINMNARLYDPVLGRMLSPDPYVVNAGYSQDYNRYSYARNNPLMYTDPTGELFGISFTKWGYELDKFLFPVAIKINIHWNSDVKGVGYDISYGVPKMLPISYRQHQGSTYYSQYYSNSYSGTEHRKGAEWTLGLIVNFSGTKFSSGETSQTTHKVTIGTDMGPHISYENDYMFGLSMPGVPKSDNGDRWRTAAVEMGGLLFRVNLNMFTGDPGLDGDYRQKNTEMIDGHLTYTGGTANKYRAGILSFGFGPLRIGRNSEQIRHIFQNRFAHDFLTGGEAKWFEVLPIPPRWFWGIDFGTGNTLW